MLFEGEYLNDHKWNGIGYDPKGNIIYELFNGNCKSEFKEYNHDGTIDFEGSCSNGLRNGKGKEYYFNRIFEGEYLNGLRNGKGKEYDKEGKLKFEGEYFCGLKHGNGKEYNKDGLLSFEGEYSNGVRNGKGKEYNEKGELMYEGYYANSEKMIRTFIFH